VWNSLDAEANEVRVDLVRNEADGVIGVTVKDDGHGISRDETNSAFKWVGNSWKRGAQTTKGVQARPLHGKRGQGRLLAFALGNTVRWTSVASVTTGQRYRSEVAATVPDRNDFTGPEPIETTDDTGTKFEATGRDNLNRLDSDGARGQITAALAPYLMSYPDVSVVYDDRPISPAQEIENDTREGLTWQHEGKAHEADLRIIEWKSGKERTLHLCDDKGVPVDDLPAKPAADFRYAAYVMWSDMPQHAGEWMLAQMEQDPGVIAALLQAVNARLSAYFDERRDAQRRALVESMLEPQWRPGEWDARLWLFAADPDNPLTGIYPCPTPGCPRVATVTGRLCRSCSIGEPGGEIAPVETVTCGLVEPKRISLTRLVDERIQLG
jgi:hypothetical protein